MERVRQRKSRTTTATEGNEQIQKHKTVRKFASESSSCERGNTKEDLFMFELGQSSSKRVTGTPMKKLLAEEMSKETEAKKRSPSVIARLMGLDGMPSPQHVHRQQKKLSDNYQQRTVSGLQRNGQLYEGRSSRKSSMEQQEFKDVYEVLESSHAVYPRSSSNATRNSKLTKAEMAFNQERSIDAKHLSTDDLVQGSKEFHDTAEMVDSDKDLMQKFLQQPDSLCVKHMHDRQGSPSSSLCSQIAVLKPSNSAKSEANSKGWRSERGTPRKPEISSRRNHDDDHISHPYNSCSSQTPQKSSKNRIDGKSQTEIPPTRIVVLKPNFGKKRSPIKNVSSPDYSNAYLSDCSRHTEYSSVWTGEAGSLGNNDIPKDAAFSKTNSREAREIAKEITRKMRDTFVSRRIHTSYSGIRGYAGDESSYSISGSDSASESELMILTSKNSLDWNNQYKRSSSGSTESFVSREAKKRMSERWKMTHRYQDVEVVCKGSTLGEMLAIPDREMSPENFDVITGVDVNSDDFGSYNGTVDCDSPLGISSRNGWKDGYIRNSSRSRSLPPLSSRSHKTSAPREALVGDRLIMPKEAMSRGRNKALKGNFNQNEGYSSKILGSSSKKSRSSRRRYACNIESLPNNHPRQKEMEINLDKEDSTERQPMVSQSPISFTSTSSVFDEVVKSEHETIAVSLESSDDLPPKPSSFMLRNGNSTVSDQETSNSQEPSTGPSEGGSVMQSPGPEPESSESSKEADHPSPVSVLEVPSTEDVSSGFECLERVGADIHELRMQLQLLKMESESYAEVPMLISGDEDLGQGSIIFFEERERIKYESWESSYLADILRESGFDEAEPDNFKTTWHSPDCALSPEIFDNLEKKYLDETTGLRSNRRLMFDRVNSALLEIFQWSMFPRPWVPPATVGVSFMWWKHGIEFELHKVILRQAKEANEDITEIMLDRQLQWLDFGEDIDAIGMKIEQLLIDDLITEIVDL